MDLGTRDPAPTRTVPVATPVAGGEWVDRLDPVAARRLQTLGWASVVVVFAAASATLCGWLLGIRRLTDLLGAGGPMVANTALALALLAIALWAVRRWPSGRWARAAAATAGGVAALIGLITLVEYGLGLSWSGFDRLFGTGAAAHLGQHPGRPAPQAAFGLIALGLALAIPATARRSGQVVRDLAATAAFGTGMLGLVGALTGSTLLFAVGRTYPMPPGTSVLLMLMAAGCQLTLPLGTTAASRLANRDPGAVLLRSCGPIVVGISALAAFVHQALGQRVHDPSVGWVIAAGAALILGGFAWRTADTLDRVDARRRVEASRSEALLASLTDSVVVIDADGVCVDAYGPPWVGAGAGGASVVGRRFDELGGTGDGGARDDAVRRALGGEAAAYEWCGGGPAGPHYSVTLSPVRVTGSSVTGAVAVARDVSELKRAELAAVVAGRRFQSVFEGAVEGIARTSLDGTIVLCNRAMARILGYDSPEQLMESVPDTRSLYVRPDERAELIAKIHDDRRLQKAEVEMRRRDGTTIWVRVASAAVTDEDGEPGGLQVIVEDVTDVRLAEAELRAAQERLRIAFHDSPQGQIVMAIAEGGMRIVEVNDAFARMLGRPPASLLDEELSSLVHPDDRITELEHLRWCHGRGVHRVNYRSRRWRPTRGWFPVDVYASLVRGPAGEPEYLVMVTDDISARVRADHERETALRVTERQSAAATSLAGLARQAIEGGDIGALLTAAAAATKEALNADHCGILRLQEDGTLVVGAVAGLGESEDAVVGLEGGAFAHSTLASGVPLQVEDWETEQRFERPAAVRARSIRTSLGVAIRHGERTFGVMGAHIRDVRTVRADDIAFVESVAHLIALVLARHDAAGALERSERTLQALVDNAPAAIHLVDAAGRFLVVNREFERIYGVDGRSLIGQTRDSVPALAGERAASHRRDDAAVIAGGEAHTVEEVSQLPDGTHTYLSVTFPVLDSRGAPFAVGGISTDVTPLKRAQEETERAWRETIVRMARAVEYRDEETGAHIERMASYCELLARSLGFDAGRAALVRTAAIMHDAGKVAIPDRVLSKEGRLTPEEVGIMQAHPAVAHELLAGSGSELLELAAMIAYTHHEKYDGTGYPRGLAGDAIPIEGRIAAVADVYDALTTDRVYRRALPVAEVIAMMKAEAGRHFDPEVLDALLAHLPEAAAIAANFASLEASELEAARTADRGRYQLWRDQTDEDRIAG